MVAAATLVAVGGAARTSPGGGPATALAVPAASAPLAFASVPGTGRFQAGSPAGAVMVGPAALTLGGAGAAVHVRFRGADRHAVVTPERRLGGIVNDLRGNEPAGWRLGLPTYGALLVHNLYPGVDLRLEGSAASGALRATFRADGSAAAAHVTWNAGGLAMPRPAAVQRVNGHPRAVAVGLRPAPHGGVRLALGRVRAGVPVSVAVTFALAGTASAAQPLAWSTYFGGATWDEAFDVDVDAAGNAYVAGFTLSSDLPRRHPLDGSLGGPVDAFVAKYGRGGALIWSSYLGGRLFDEATSIAVDDAGNSFVTGRTQSPDFPVRRALQPHIRGHSCQNTPCHDAFVTKLSPAGRLVYSTYLGGSENEDGVGVAVDSQGNAYVSGNTGSRDFPTRNALQGSFQSLPCAGDLPCSPDSFVTKIAASGSSLVYSTYLGGGDSDTNGGVAVDAGGNALVVGSTRSTDFPVRNPVQRHIKGLGCGPPAVPCRDVYVAKLAPGGRPAVFSTYLGGTKTEVSGGIATDARGNVYVTGSTGSSDFPVARALQPSIGNSSCDSTTPVKELCDDAFLTKLRPDGGAPVFSTFLGGNASDQGLGVAVSDGGSAVVTGRTDSRNFPVAHAAQPHFGGFSDAFLTRFAPTGRSLLASTYLGGSKAERSNGVGLADTGRAVVAGRTESLDFPTMHAAQRRSHGDLDAFVSSLG